MKKLSGIAFADPRLLRAFEREASRRLPADEAHRLLSSYTVHILPDGMLLEFRDMAAVAYFLERARDIDLAGRSIHIIKLVSLTTTGAYRTPANEVDRWARQRIDRIAHDGIGREALVFRADQFALLGDEFSDRAIDLSRYLR